MPAVSDLALIIFAATVESLAHDGMSPQRTSDISRTGSFGFWWMIGTFWVGAMLYRGFQSRSTGAVSKYPQQLVSAAIDDSVRTLENYCRSECHSAFSSTGRSNWPMDDQTHVTTRIVLREKKLRRFAL
jgi:hypothetical protein